MFKELAVALAIVVTPSVFAQGQESALALDVSASFVEQRERIRAEFADGETYSEIAREQQAEVQRALGRIESTLGEAGSVSELTPQERADLMNDQEMVNTILTLAREDSRLVCKRETKVGSHRTTTECATVAQRRKTREQSQSELQRGQRTMLRPSN
jgi:hypothetical protein